MITPSFGLTATERVLPKLALDFTTALLDSRITFTRTTGASNPATYVNNNGILTTATNNQPRFDYDPVTLACKGLLIEESRANLSTASNNFSTWVSSPATSVSFASAQATSPDGTNDGWKLIESSALSGHSAYTVRSGLTASTAYTYSIYAKSDGSGRRLSGYPSGGAAGSWRVNLTTGAVESGTATVTNAGNGWWRISSVYTTNVGSTSCLTWLSLYNGGGTYQGDGVSGAYVFGEQFELGAFATSYIPTTTTALTRNADVAVMTGTNFSDWFNASQGAFYASGDRVDQTSFAAFFSANDGTTANEIYGTQNSSAARAFTRKSGGVNGDVTASGTWSTGSVGSFAFGYKANDLALSYKGNTVATDVSADVPTVTTLNIGTRGSNAFPINGHVAKIMYWPQRLTNAEIQAFSK